MTHLYILEGTTPLAVQDTITWGQLFATADWKVAHTQVSPDAEVSTVFLGMDHNFFRDGPPILWESMVFGGPLDGEQERYATYHNAAQGHEAMVERCRAAVAGAANVEGLTS